MALPPPQTLRPPMHDIKADNDDDAEGILAHLGMVGAGFIGLGFLILGLLELARQLLFCRKKPTHS